MKITDVKVETIRIPMKKPFRIAFAVQDHSLNVLVKISTDEGLWGIGEAAPFEPVTGESAATVLEALKLFRTGLIGMDPLDVEGIHCRSPRWGRFTLWWDEIRTYGFYGYSFSYMSMPFLYFSLDPAEYAPQNGGEAARIGRDRIIFQYRPSIWAALTEYMPRDMVKRLDDVIRNERGGHFRRRPGA